jgi:hypothetical protein
VRDFLTPHPIQDISQLLLRVYVSFTFKVPNHVTSRRDELSKSFFLFCGCGAELDLKTVTVINMLITCLEEPK